MADINPHTCPHPEWVDASNIPGDDEDRCTACGTVYTYIKKYHRPCCGYGTDQNYPYRDDRVITCKWDDATAG